MLVRAYVVHTCTYVRVCVCGCRTCKGLHDASRHIGVADEGDRGGHDHTNGKELQVGHSHKVRLTILMDPEVGIDTICHVLP
jgi:hypothetical protein